MAHGTVAPTLEADLDAARDRLNRLAALGISPGAVTEKLLEKASSRSPNRSRA